MSGEELRRRRLALGLSQPELAAQLGIHHNTLCRWERQGVPRLSVELAKVTLERLERQETMDGSSSTP